MGAEPEHRRRHTQRHITVTMRNSVYVFDADKNLEEVLNHVPDTTRTPTPSTARSAANYGDKFCICLEISRPARMVFLTLTPIVPECSEVLSTLRHCCVIEFCGKRHP